MPSEIKIDRLELLRVAQNVFQEEAEALEKTADGLGEDFLRAVEAIFQCKGKVVFSGVGKSGLVARKIASTFSSLGTTSVFLHPTDALHGDLGIIGTEDLFIAISHSGSSEELLKIVPSLKLRGIGIISICRDANNELSQVSDHVLTTQVFKEACSLDLAPTTSTTVTMAFGDALAVALVNARGFRKEDFALLHPGGALGQKLLARVREVLIPASETGIARESDGVQILAEQMNRSNLGIVIIMGEEGNVRGVVSDGDLRRAVSEPDFARLKASSLMSQNPKKIYESMLVSEAIYFAEKHRITALIVIDKNQKFVGVVNFHDLLNFYGNL